MACWRATWLATANQLQPAGADAHCAAVRVGDRSMGSPGMLRLGGLFSASLDT